MKGQNMNKVEKRVHPRVSFSVDDDFAVQLEQQRFESTDTVVINAHVLNLSEGGICLTGSSPALLNLKAEDKLRLVGFAETGELDFLQDIALQIRYAVHERKTDYVMAGFRFLDINPEQQKNTARFVEARRKQKPERRN